jgi:hypothetical protein
VPSVLFFAASVRFGRHFLCAPAASPFDGGGRLRYADGRLIPAPFAALLSDK